ncbi:tyrosine-type recombinase/integrase [Arthrobacter bambusae]|uniref:tyrosine-type recombinase/integrase n=1 Tax=Arthrobacter bambusae TaxID=1338426 RepID=UPI0027D8518C|nr:tyrosine-type recombinase/integrase [Arthrobacter bambusae]
MFTTPKGGRIVHKLYWHHYWVPAVEAAQARGLKKAPRIHALRHTHASWLIQEGVSLFTVSRRLGHASTRTTEQVYGHLMPRRCRMPGCCRAIVDCVASLRASVDATRSSVVIGLVSRSFSAWTLVSQLP